jgi:hypothetical protein
MQRLEVSGAVRHIYIYIYIYIGGKGLNKHGANLIFLKQTQVLTPFGMPQVAQCFRRTHARRPNCYDYIQLTTIQTRGSSSRTDMNE